MLGRTERAAKVRLHAQIAADPRAHAWTLSLYRAGERHPETVSDYFPCERARDRWPELAASMRRHAGDERGHALLYQRAIERMGERVLDVPDDDVFNVVIRKHTDASWQIADDDDANAVRLKLAHFMAHAHHLEKRIARSLRYHHEGCVRAGRGDVASTVERVLSDEERHVSYTFEAVVALTTTAERATVMQAHADGERRADRAFSSRQLRTFLAEHGGALRKRDRILYALAAFAMEP